MSLLMDALKRAEESKQEAAPAASGASPALSLESRAESPTVLPDLAAHLNAVDADLAAVAGGAPSSPLQAPRPAPHPDPGRQSAYNAFAAKQESPADSRRPLWWILALLGAASAGIGLYVWFQLQAMNPSSSLRPPAPTPSPVPAGASSPPRPQPPLPAASPSPAPMPTASLPPLPLAPPAERPGAPVSTTPYPPPRPMLEAERPASALSASPAASPIRLARSRPEPDPHLMRAYRSLQAGEFDLARIEYEQALRADPRSVDALLGLSSLAQREGRAAEAERLSRLALEADPLDAAAQAANIALAANADATTVESRLKMQLATQPESAPLNFALGNLYARQARWPEAQPAYFSAVAAESDNPDYLFNLAVSLDHLRQSRLAAQHYRLALEAAERRSAAFDREQARRRLAQLQP